MSIEHEIGGIIVALQDSHLSDCRIYGNPTVIRDLEGDFQEQPSDIDCVDTEYVDQRGEVDFCYGKMAYPLSDGTFLQFEFEE